MGHTNFETANGFEECQKPAYGILMLIISLAHRDCFWSLDIQDPAEAWRAINHSNLWNRSFERPRVGRIKGESKDRAQIWNYNAWKKCAEAKSELL